MKHLTEDRYIRMQLFQVPQDLGMGLDMDLTALQEEFELEPEDYLITELMGREEWYDDYLPDDLHDRMFDSYGEICLQDIDASIFEDIAAFHAEAERDWTRAVARAKQEKQQLWQTAVPSVRTLLKLDLADSELGSITGIGTDTVQVVLYPQWDMSRILTLTFSGVQGGRMGRIHPQDANWWIADEIRADGDSRYSIGALIVHADRVEELAFTFSDVTVEEKEDPLGI